MKVLIIFELIPEDTLFCIVENPSKEELELFDKACTQFVNLTKNEEDAVKLNDYLEEKGAMRIKTEEDRLYIKNILSQKFDQVCWAGFVL